MDKILKVIVAVFICFLFSSVFSQVSANSKIYDQSLYNEVHKLMTNVETDFTITHTGNVKNMSNQLNTIMNDIRLADSYAYENLSSWTASFSIAGNKAYIDFKITYLTTKQAEKYVNEQVEKLLPTILKGKKTEYDKVKAVHDYIVSNTEYSKNTRNSGYITYTLLTENKGVCQAYSLMMYKMMKQAGIDVRYMKGYAGREAHSWNLVKIGNEWYHIDATWNDPIGNPRNVVKYHYFLKTDAEMVKTHVWNQSEYPVATSLKYRNSTKK